jgi:hypothetical protein
MRVLFVSDTHLGIDMPTRPRVTRRRRGEDFFRNFERALAVARGAERSMSCCTAAISSSEAGCPPGWLKRRSPP